MSYPFVAGLDRVLIEFPPSGALTIQEACNGLHVLGGIGSGKSSGKRTRTTPLLRGPGFPHGKETDR